MNKLQADKGLQGLGDASRTRPALTKAEELAGVAPWITDPETKVLFLRVMNEVIRPAIAKATQP